MISLMCFLMVFGLGRCLDPLQTQREIETSINRTISEVERLIKNDSTLPQLSRSQIVEILYNITSKDMDLMEESVEKSRLDYQRALTVVLPYNSKDAKNEDIKDLYTKPPMTHVISDSDSVLPYSSIQEEPPVTSDPVFENIISTKYPDEVKNSFQYDNNEYKNHRTTYDKSVKVGSTSHKFNFNLNNLDSAKNIWPTTNSILKLINSDNNINSTKPKLEIIYSTSVTDKPTTKMLMTTTRQSIDNFKPTMPTKQSTINILTSDQWRYFAPPSTTTTKTTTTSTTTEKSTTPSRKLRNTTPRLLKPSPFRLNSQPFLPTVMSTSEWPTHPTYAPSRKIPEISSTVKTFNMTDMVMMSDEPTPMLFVTPMSYKSSGNNLNSTLSIVSSNKQQQADLETLTPMRDGVTTLLASIGLKPKEEQIIADDTINFVNEQGIFATNFHIPPSNNTARSQTSALTANKVDSPSIINQNTFDNVHKDVQKGVDNLTPDVQLLFQRFGLQTSKNYITSTTTKAPTHFSFKTNSWNSFKPLPKSEIKDEGMKDFLAKFGLGLADNRNSKSMKKLQEHSVIEAVPSGMKNILENIGLIVKPKSPRNVRVTTPKITKSIVKASTTEDPLKIHIFKPHEVIIGDPQQKLKINELLDTVKLVQEGHANVSDVRKIADDLLKTTKTLQEGPNPLSLDEIFRIYNNDVKNEVKRDESKANLSDDVTTTSNSEISEVMIDITGNNSSKNTSDSLAQSSDTLDTSHDNSDGRIVTSGIATTASTTITTTELSLSTDNSNLNALADSFGGSTAAPDPVLPTPKKSGLYFLVDWNSFLEVGVDGEDKVNLRFAPKVGDRTRFIPVVVP